MMRNLFVGSSKLLLLLMVMVAVEGRRRQLVKSEYAESNLVDSRTYLIKFLTDRTIYPIKLVDHTTPVPDRHVKWLKYGSGYFIDQLDQHQNYFRMEREFLTSSSNHSPSTTNGARTNLVILNYDGKNNFILDHYEPKHEKPDEAAIHQVESDNDQEEEEEDPISSDRNIYTLVYMKSFELIANETGESDDDREIHFGCRLRFVVPNGIIDQHTVIISERLEKLVHLKLSVVNDKGEKHVRRRSRRYVDENGEGNHGVMTAVYNQPSSTLFELEMFEGPITIRKYDVTDLTTTCRLVLKDYDGSTALDTTQTKRVVQSSSPIGPHASTHGSGADSLTSPSKLFLLILSAFLLF